MTNEKIKYSHMKKVVLLLAVFIFTITITSCKSSKSGCGLTSDAAPIYKLGTIMT